MSFPLEKAEDPSKLRRHRHRSRVARRGPRQGHDLLDEHHKGAPGAAHIVEFRGFERFHPGPPVLGGAGDGAAPLRHLSGQHQLAASKALDFVVGARTPTRTAEKVRRLMHYGQILQSHALHFYHLSSPDLLLGFDSGRGEAQPSSSASRGVSEIARQGVMLRKFGQRSCRVTAGKRVHGTGSIPGGV